MRSKRFGLWRNAAGLALMFAVGCASNTGGGNTGDDAAADTANAADTGSGGTDAGSVRDAGTRSDGQAQPDAPTQSDVQTPLDSGRSACPAPDLTDTLTFESAIDPNSSTWSVAMPDQHVVSDPTADGGHSYHVHYVYDPNSDSGEDIFGMFLDRPQRRVFAHMRYKQGTDFDNSGIKKLIRFHGRTGDPNNGPEIMVGGVAVMWGHFSIGLDGLSDGRNLAVDDPSLAPDALEGTWVDLQMMVDISTSNALVYRLWVNGTLAVDQTVPLPNMDAYITFVQFGGTFNAPGATTDDWIDDASASTQCISSSLGP